MWLRKNTYIPILKTTDSELRAYAELSDWRKDSITPLFELTKSRVSKKNFLGDLGKNIEKIFEIQSNRPFILDLTKEPGLSNPEMKALCSQQDGYKNWYDFLKGIIDKHPEAQVIPCLQVDLIEQVDLAAWDGNLKKQISLLSETFKMICVRTDALNPDLISYINSCFPNPDRHLLLLDNRYLHSGAVSSPEEKTLDTALYETKAVLDKLKSEPKKFRKVAISGSSYPKSFNDGRNEIPLLEISLFRDIEAIYSNKFDLIYSDFASIHPKRYVTSGGRPIPRVDYPLKSKIVYIRQRYKDKSEIGSTYSDCARKLYQEFFSKYKLNLSTWGEDEIKAAALGQPSGKNPAFWISVRANIHMCRQLERINGN